MCTPFKFTGINFFLVRFELIRITDIFLFFEKTKK